MFKKKTYFTHFDYEGNLLFVREEEDGRYTLKKEDGETITINPTLLKPVKAGK